MEPQPRSEALAGVESPTSPGRDEQRPEAVPRDTPSAGSVWQRAFAVVALCLALAGAGIASYLAAENLQGKSGVCTVVHGCQTVQQSAFGKVFGVPVSVPGLAMYAFLVAAALVVLTNFRGLRSVAAFLAFNGALFGFCFSLYLTYVEGWVLNAWCIYCIGSATLMTLLLVCWGTILGIEVHRRRDEPGEGAARV